MAGTKRKNTSSTSPPGKPMEIQLVPPNVWMGAERTVGIRVRIPTGPAPIGNRPGSGRGAGHRTAAKPVPDHVTKPPPTLEQQQARALAGTKRAPSRDNPDAWTHWAKGFASDEGQREALEDAYRHSLERAAVAEAATLAIGAGAHRRHPRPHPDRPGAERQSARPRRPHQHRWRPRSRRRNRRRPPTGGIRVRTPTSPAPSGSGLGTGAHNRTAPPVTPCQSRCRPPAPAASASASRPAWRSTARSPSTSRPARRRSATGPGREPATAPKPTAVPAPKPPTLQRNERRSGQCL